MDKVNVDKYINLEEAAEYLGIKAPTLRSWIKNPKNEVPAHKVGRLWKFKRSEINAWVDSSVKRYDLEDQWWRLVIIIPLSQTYVEILSQI